MTFFTVESLIRYRQEILALDISSLLSVLLHTQYFQRLTDGQANESRFVMGPWQIHGEFTANAAANAAATTQATDARSHRDRT